MWALAFYWSLFISQFVDAQRKVALVTTVIYTHNTIYTGFLGDVDPPCGHPCPACPQLAQSHAQDGLSSASRP